MTEPSRIRDHAQAAGFGTTELYALELEDVIEGIVSADLDRDDQDMHGALMRARALVDSWEQV